MVATNECVAIEKYCHSKTMWSYGHITTKFDPLHYIALATYQIWSIDDMLMQRSSLRGNICRLQHIRVGGDKGHMQ
jgi:hypothetical protein